MDSNTKKRVWFYPVYTKNEYTNMMQECIHLAGYDVCQSNSIFELLNADIVDLNWFESLSDKWYRRILTYLYKRIVIWIIRVKKIPTVATFHNKTSHDKLNDVLGSRLRELYYNSSDGIALHSKSSARYLNDKLRERSCYIPHPNYCNAYKNGKDYSGYHKKDGELLVLSFGLIRPYKNIELLFRLADDYKKHTEVKFLVCGNCPDQTYKNNLIKKEKTSNIILDIRFIHNDEIVSLFKVSDIVILPYNTMSALNSGAAILSFSLGKTVISTNTATIEDLQDMNLVYSYDYSDNTEEHYRRLKATFDKMYLEYKDNPTILQQKGDLLMGIELSTANYNNVASSIKGLFTKISSKKKMDYT